MKKTTIITLLTLLLFLPGCSLLTTRYEAPRVSLKGVTLVPDGNNVIPKFKIDLHLINPNSAALPIKGVFYTLKVEGMKLLSGVSDKLPIIAAYSEADVTLYANIDLVGGMKLINRFLGGKSPDLKYEFDAKIDTGTFSPSLHIKEKGNLMSALGLKGETD